MARSKQRREQHRTAVVEREGQTHAEIIVPVDSFESADGDRRVLWTDIASRFGSLSTYPATLGAAPSQIALVLDDFAFDLHIGDRFVATGTHDGVTFRRLAVDHGVDVYLANGVDVRRSAPRDLAAAATDGRLVGSRVTAFGVDTLELR